MAAARYYPGQTLTPDCGPTDADCTVSVPAIAGTNADITSLSGLTSITSNSLTITNLLSLLGNLGLGTTTPWGKLSIAGLSSNTAPLFTISTTTSGNATSTAFIIDSNGKVGIGTTSPYTQVAVTGGVALTNSLLLENTTNSTTGVIFKGGAPFIHDFAKPGNQGSNTFVGRNSGNFTMGGAVDYYGSFNTGLGAYALNANSTGYDNTAIGYLALANNTTGFWNTAVGMDALKSNTTGQENTAVGQDSMPIFTSGNYNVSLGGDSFYNFTSGSENTGIGTDAFNKLDSGSYNVAVGKAALSQGTTFSNATAVGYHAGYNNTSSAITAIGYQALLSNTSGINNVAVGDNSLSLVTIGTNNVAVGYDASQRNTASFTTALGSYSLNTNTTGANNTALGYAALYYNNTGTDSTAVGYKAAYANTATYTTALGSNALVANTSGAQNTAVGFDSLQAVVTGGWNSALGFESGLSATGSNNTLLGNYAGTAYHHTYSLTTGSQNTFVGSEAGLDDATVGVQPTNSIAIGYLAGVTASNQVVLGNSSITQTILRGSTGISTTSPWRTLSVVGTMGIQGLTSSAVGNALCITGNNEVTTASVAACSGVSSKRFKHDILDTDLGLSTILNLHPITFKYNQGYGDSGKDPQFGLIAEEVEKIDPRLIILDSGGLPTAVRYDFLPTILVRAVQELSAKVDNLISNGLAIIKNVVADSITAAVGYFKNLVVGSSESPSGITLYDKNGKPGCITLDDVTSGSVKVTQGACVSVGAASLAPAAPISTSSPTASPTIILLGNNPASIILGSNFIDPGATSLDSNGTSLMPDIASSTVNTSIAGTYQVIWTVHDSAMNYASTTRTVVVTDNSRLTTDNQNSTTTATTTETN